MYEQLDPDFDARSKIIQPQTQVRRAAFRSPISSEDLNYFQISVVEDLDYLYAKFESIEANLAAKLKDIYQDGGIQFSVDIILETLYDYGTKLRYIREELENLR